MRPELFELPVIHLTIKSYGLMMVIGFLVTVTLIRRLSRSFTDDPQLITNAALYSLIGGVIGARLFYVIHYFEQFQSEPFRVFAIWNGGLELLGGVIVAITVILSYLIYHKQPVRRYLDVLAVGLMVALAFGRIGCFLNGCCWGKPTDLPWAVRFPYGSLAYYSQINPDQGRNRQEPYLQLPQDYFSYIDENGKGYLLPLNELSEKQQMEVTKGQYRCLPVHPTQLYSSISAAFVSFLLYLIWRRSEKNKEKRFAQPGSTFSMMFILYGIMRISMEFLRDDNPFEFDGLTISQNIGISMIAAGLVFLTMFELMKGKKLRS
ncbi:prolipoprotein diacylglyceryl transferase [Planctomycetota bacterium]